MIIDQKLLDKLLEVNQLVNLMATKRFRLNSVGDSFIYMTVKINGDGSLTIGIDKELYPKELIINITLEKDLDVLAMIIKEYNRDE